MGLQLQLSEGESVEIHHGGQVLLVTVSGTRARGLVFSGPQSFRVVRSDARDKNDPDTLGNRVA
jgi:hypothetical protein